MELREFLSKLKQHGQLVEINKRVDLDFELAAVIETMLQQGRPIGLFTNTGHSSGIPVVGGVLGDIKRIALALDCAEGDMKDRLAKAVDNLIETVEVEEAPFKANVIKGTDLNLREQLPIPHHNRGDGGPYITGGIMISRDPKSGRQNYSFNRLQVKGPNKLGIVMNEWRHIYRFHKALEEQGQDTPIAVAIGVDPAVEIAAGFRIEEDEGLLAGAINGRALQVSKCHMVDIKVPADTEIVVEGFIKANVREEEGPLAEFTGHYGEVWNTPIVEVTAISYRDNPIFQTIVPASFEHVYIGNVLPREPMLKKMVSHVSPNILDVHLTPYTGGFMAVISVDKKNAGEPKNIALAALMTHVNIKIAVIVDPDVNIYQPSDVLWAFATRVDAQKDIFFVPYAQGMENDPTTNEEGTHTKIAIDATLHHELREDYKRVKYPMVNLDTYF